MANVLATDYMIPVYNGKVVVFTVGAETKIKALTQEQVDEAIEYMETFSGYSSLAYMQYNVSQIRYDDQRPIVLGEDTINASEVPGDLTYNITVEPQFIKVNG